MNNLKLSNPTYLLYNAVYNGSIEEVEYCMTDEIIFDEDEILTNYAIHGILNNLEFAKWIYNQEYKSCDIIQKYICEKFIMNNILDETLLNKFKNNIFRIWKPETPSSITCFKLLELGLDYQVAIIAILNNWNDVYDKCNIKSDISLYNLSKFTNNKYVSNDQVKKSKNYNGFHKIIDFDYGCLFLDRSITKDLDINIVGEFYSYVNQTDKKQSLTPEFFDEGLDMENRDITPYDIYFRIQNFEAAFIHLFDEYFEKI